jgi:serine/threonine protein kinase
MANNTNIFYDTVGPNQPLNNPSVAKNTINNANVFYNAVESHQLSNEEMNKQEIAAINANMDKQIKENSRSAYLSEELKIKTMNTYKLRLQTRIPHEIQNKIKIELQKNPELKQNEYTFEFFSLGTTSTLYKFTANGKVYVLKKTEVSRLPIKILPKSDVYITPFYVFDIGTSRYSVQLLLGDYVLLEQMIYDIRFISVYTYRPCYRRDIHRWKIIYNLIEAIIQLHKNGIYHRDLKPNNIMIHPKTYKIMLIDLDNSCTTDDDCGKDLQLRYKQHSHYTTDTNHIKASKFNSKYAEKIDWYAVGIICMEILYTTSIEHLSIIELVKNDLEKIKSSNGVSLNRLASIIYPNCSIHVPLYNEICDKILNHCFTGNSTSIIENIDWFKKIQTHYFNYKEDDIFLIHGDGSFVYHYIIGVHRNMIEHILSHSFPNKHIVFYNNYKDKTGAYDLARDNMESGSSVSLYKIIKTKEPDLIFRNTHHFVEPHDTKPYKVPYISFSIEPWRVKLNPKQLPLYEITTVLKNEETSKNIPNSNESNTTSALYKNNVLEHGRQLYYYNNRKYPIKWIPYISQYYGDNIAFDTEWQPFKLPEYVEKHKNDEKKMWFVFMASNCSSKIRNGVFTILKQKEIQQNKNKGKVFNTKPDEEQLVRAYGKCLKTVKDKHPFDEDATCALSEIYKGAVTARWSTVQCIYSESKFTFTFENDLRPGYITEKIMAAFRGNSVPIYYGPPEIKNLFNENRFYYVNEKLAAIQTRLGLQIDMSNPTEQALKEMANELWALAADDGPTGWKKFMVGPLFVNDKIPEIFLYKTAPWMTEIITHIQQNYESDKQKAINTYNSRVKAIPAKGGRYTKRNRKYNKKSRSHTKRHSHN